MEKVFRKSRTTTITTMIKRITIFLIFLPTLIHGQNSITFKVENLSEPEGLLWVKSYDDILHYLILSDYNLSRYDLEERGFDFNIVGKNTISDSLVSYGYHSFFSGMFEAYANHRPFVLSPDMIWLLLSQGFAQHVNANAEALRHHFVDFEGKVTLIVRNDNISLEDPNSPWESVFPEFTNQISQYTGNELIETLTSDFTTTTPTTKVASEITIMEAMSPYFEFIVMYVICGIPEITLEGTPADWQKVLDKANSLRKYELDWWIDEVEPLLKQFVNASNGKVKKRFWRNMFKYHSKRKYGAPKIIDGWIVKFFPYDNDGNRKNLNKVISRDDLPNEIVKVDMEYHQINENGTVEITPLELWAGFVGLKQNPENYALRPEIGWMVRKRDDKSQILSEEFKHQNEGEFGGIQIRVKTVPPEILELKSIRFLEIQFVDEILIPDEMGNIEIQHFRMTGKINKDGIDRLMKLFPNTVLSINDKVITPKDFNWDKLIQQL